MFFLELRMDVCAIYFFPFWNWKLFSNRILEHENLQSIIL